MRKSGANHHLVQPCGHCGAPRIPHRVCASCGQYNGQQIVAKPAAEE